VSVLVPAYNEAKVIDKTIRSLLNSTYPNLEIVVIDDGSTDDTYACVVSEFSGEPRLRVFRKENGGKAQALNYGIQKAAGEIIIALDADTVIMPQAVALMVRHMNDPRVCAVAGNAKVGNRINPLTRMQALEYISGQNMDRRAFALLNCITVVPGAIGAWRKDRVLEVGGFQSDTEFYVFFLLIDFLSTLLAFIMEAGEDWRLILWMFPQRLFYRQLMYYTSIKSMLSAIKGQAVGWGKLERKATVKT
jgi:peptidoglycan-N-acetylglucosamine deacetylase